MRDVKVTEKLEDLNPNDILSSHQAARFLQVNASSVVKWIKQGKLAAYRTPGGHQRIVARDLLAFAESQAMSTSAADDDPAKRLLGTTEVARLLQVNPSTVVKWIKAGHLPAQTTPGNFHRVVASDLIAFADAYNMPLSLDDLEQKRPRIRRREQNDSKSLN